MYVILGFDIVICLQWIN